MCRTSLPLDRIRIASPCPASWQEMEGDDRVRTCDHCQMQVFNLSGMRQREAEKLIVKAEGRLCVRLYQRADGTIITADCPLGLIALRRVVCRAIAYGAGVVALLFAYLAGVVSSVTERPVATTSAGRPPGPVTTFVDWVENKLFPRPIMGEMCPPTSPTLGGGNGMDKDCEPDAPDGP
jgi:hypothetical protein